MTTKNAMCYVAVDKDQPGAAYAIVVDDPAFKKSVAECVADWILEGASVEHVALDAGQAMLSQWKRRPKTEGGK